MVVVGPVQVAVVGVVDVVTMWDATWPLDSWSATPTNPPDGRPARPATRLVRGYKGV
jgi:hypothetical protein